jgi:hypothetical protein
MKNKVTKRLQKKIREQLKSIKKEVIVSMSESSLNIALNESQSFSDSLSESSSTVLSDSRNSETKPFTDSTNIVAISSQLSLDDVYIGDFIFISFTFSFIFIAHSFQIEDRLKRIIDPLESFVYRSQIEGLSAKYERILALLDTRVNVCYYLRLAFYLQEAFLFLGLTQCPYSQIPASVRRSN